MVDKELIERLWESDEASVLTNQAARQIEKLEGLLAAHRDLRALYESTKAELEKARARVVELERDVEELEALRAPVILRKQAEAVEQCWTDIAEMVFSTEVRTPQGALNQAAGYCADYSLRLRQQAEAAEQAGGEK